MRFLLLCLVGQISILAASSPETAPADAKVSPDSLLQTLPGTLEEGKWSGYYQALRQTLCQSADNGPRQRWPYNLDAILQTPKLVLFLEQARFIRSCHPDVLEAFADSDSKREFLQWLLGQPQILKMFNDTVAPEDKLPDALNIWQQIWNEDKQSADRFAALAIACALVFDEPMSIDPRVLGSANQSSQSAADSMEVNALARFRFYRQSELHGALRNKVSTQLPWELLWVVDAPVPESELAWAQSRVNYPRSAWGQAYDDIRYRMDMVTANIIPWKTYTLAEIKKEGGICGDRAYFASISAKANGIPAMSFVGEGQRGWHAWFGFNASGSRWKLAGRYEGDSYSSGTTLDPQRRVAFTEQKILELTDPAQHTDLFLRGTQLYELAVLLKENGRMELATFACEKALQAAPKNLQAWWMRLDFMEQANVPSKEWLAEVARVRTIFHKFPDIVLRLNERELAYTANQKGSADTVRVARLQSARMLRRDADRTDLFLQLAFKSADVARQSGQPEAEGRIYRDALKDKGGEQMAFTAIAERYYQWGKANGKGPSVLREILSFHDRNFHEGDDLFRQEAYFDTLNFLAKLCEDAGLKAQQQSMERRLAKFAKAQRDLAKQNPEQRKQSRHTSRKEQQDPGQN